MGALAPGADVAATSRAWYDELRLAGAVRAGLHDTGLDEGEAWLVTDRVRVLLALARPSAIGGACGGSPTRSCSRPGWRSLELRAAIGVNTWEGVEYLDRDRFVDLLAGRRGSTPSMPAQTPSVEAPFVERLAAAAEAAGYRVDRACAKRSAAPCRPKPPR